MNDLIELLNYLVAINSINPDLNPGAAGEGEIARAIAGWLERAGLEVAVHEPKPGRLNVVGIARGSGGGKRLMLNGHMDTVGVAGMENPFRPVVQDGKLFGRGSFDMKGGLAACMLAAAAAKKERLRGDVIVTAVMDEEYAGLGTIAIAQRYGAEGAIVAESTGLDLIVAHKGFVWLEIETTGVAAHGSRPDLGVDAILKIGPVLQGLEKLQQELRQRKLHPLLGNGSLHASLIEGGQELSSYPERCVLAVERRTLPGETPEAVEDEMQAILTGIGRGDPQFKARVRRGIDRLPMETPMDDPIVSILREAAINVNGAPPEITGVPYWTDAATLWQAGIPSVLYGPSGEGAHAVVEWVDLQSVETCAQVYLEAARQFCK